MSDLPPGFVLDKPHPQPAAGGLPPGFTVDTRPPSTSEEGGSTAGALWDGLLHGMGNVAQGVGRLAVHAIPESELKQRGDPGAVERVDREAQQRQEAFRQQPSTRAHPYAARGGEMAGEMAVTAPAGVSRGLAPLWQRLVQGGVAGAATGAVGAASSAPGGKEFAPAVATGAGVGAAIGAGAGAAGSAARPSSMAAPRVPPASMVNAPETRSWREAARMLTSQDVRLSPGQARNAGYKERSLQEWPILRNLVRGAVGRSVDDFDRAVVLQALSPIGGVVPRSVPAGHDLMEFGTKQINTAYDGVLPNLQLSQPGIANWLQNDADLKKIVSEMATDDAKRLTTIIQNRLLDPLSKAGGVIDGPAFKKIESDLSGRAASFRGGNSDELGKALSYVVSGARDELANQNPKFAAELQKINHAFSMWARVRAAAGRDVDGKSRFSPRDLLYAIRGEDESAGRNSFVRGRQPMQAFAEAGSEIIDPSLSSRMPETSKSAARYVGDVIGGAVGTVPYGAAMAGQAIPGLSQGIGALGPGLGFVGGRESPKRRPLRSSVGAE